MKHACLPVCWLAGYLCRQFLQALTYPASVMRASGGGLYCEASPW